MSLIFCACKCGGQIEELDSRGRKRKYIKGHMNKGDKNGMYGKISPMRNKHPSKETIKKQSESHKGQHSSPSTEFKKGEHLGKEHTQWKGGYKLRMMRKRSNRQNFGFGFIPLNSCEVNGWIGHHLDRDYVIFIPEEVHKSVWHSVTKNRSMDIINDKVYDWFMNYYFGRNL